MTTYNMSNYLEAEIHNHLLRTPTWSKPSVLAFALCSGVPNSANTGANLPELPNANGYARVNYGAPHNSGWQTKGADTGGANTLEIRFPTNITANWGIVSGIAILDSATHGAGNMLMWGALTTPRTVIVGDTPVLASGSLVVNWD